MTNEVIKSCEEKMVKTINVYKQELKTMKAGRANPSILDKIEVEYYGTLTPLSQMANVSAPEPRILLIQPYDKTSIKGIEKAILSSDLGLNPSNDGIAIRLIIPELTEETRRDLVKKIKKLEEIAKVAIRSIRRDANEKFKAFKKDNEITEDEFKKAEEKVQKVTDSYIKEIEGITFVKEKEIMSV
ncbi:MAG: ribosome recycling factor [Clostridiaceae bacterium]